MTRSSVESAMVSGAMPTRWWKRLPTAGQASSTERIREAPTSQRG